MEDLSGWGHTSRAALSTCALALLSMNELDSMHAACVVAFLYGGDEARADAGARMRALHFHEGLRGGDRPSVRSCPQPGSPAIPQHMLTLGMDCRG